MRRSSDLAPLCLLNAWWLATCVVVGPPGNFPLNDDWSYGTTVERMFKEGRLHFGSWQSMPMLTHAIWGFAFAKTLGFSRLALRVSSMAAAWLALVSFYFLLRGLRWRRWGAFLAAGVLLVNPIFVARAQTFMTDITFLAMSLGSAACGVWALRQVQTGRFVGWWSLATLAAVMSTRNRQLGVALPLAFGAATMLLPARGVRPRRGTATFVLVPAALCLLALAIYGICRRSSDNAGDGGASSCRGLFPMASGDRAGRAAAGDMDALRRLDPRLPGLAPGPDTALASSDVSEHPLPRRRGGFRARQRVRWRPGTLGGAGWPARA